MRYFFSIMAIVAAVTFAQLALAPAFLPPVLRPDLGILMGLAALAFAPRDFAFILLFCLGLSADLFGSARFGLLTLSYLLAAGLLLACSWRELTRGDFIPVWLLSIAGTALAHLFYIIFGRIAGLQVHWGQALAIYFSLVLSACVWGLPCAYIGGHCLRGLGILTIPVRERWARETRQRPIRRVKARNIFGG
jgi:hypothetical protein